MNEPLNNADIVVIGAGTMGAMTLWQLSQLSQTSRPTIVGIEQFGPAHTHGSFSGESRLFRVAVKEGAFYVPLAQQARELWKELNEQTAKDIFLEIGALSIGPKGCEPMEVTESVIAEFGLPAEAFTASELKERFPQFRINADDYGILDPAGGGIRPELAIASALRLAQDAGVHMHYNTEVLDISPIPGGGVRVTTDRGTIQAGTAIVTVGSWATRLLPSLADLIHIEPIGLTWFISERPELFEAHRLPVFMRDIDMDGEPVHLFGAPSLDGFSVKICPNLDRQPVGHPALARPYNRQELRLIGERAQYVFPDILPEPVRASMHHDAFTADGTPIIEANDGLIVAAGMSGKGMKFAPIYGRMLAELALTGSSDLYQPEFSEAAHRPAAVASPAPAPV